MLFVGKERDKRRCKEGTRSNEAFHSFGRLLKEADVGVSILRGSRRERIEIKEIIKSTLGKNSVDGSFSVIRVHKVTRRSHIALRFEIIK